MVEGVIQCRGDVIEEISMAHLYVLFLDLLWPKTGGS